MSLTWLTVLRNVPWTDVISNAPKVAEGAKKLWKTVVKKPPSPALSGSVALEARVITLEAAVSELHGQMLASSELIKTLAEQNAQLIRRIETLRVRVLWVGATTAAVALAALFGLLH